MLSSRRPWVSGPSGPESSGSYPHTSTEGCRSPPRIDAAAGTDQVLEAGPRGMMTDRQAQVEAQVPRRAQAACIQKLQQGHCIAHGQVLSPQVPTAEPQRAAYAAAGASPQECIGSPVHPQVHTHLHRNRGQARLYPVLPCCCSMHVRATAAVQSHMLMVPGSVPTPSSGGPSYPAPAACFWEHGWAEAGDKGTEPTHSQPPWDRATCYFCTELLYQPGTSWGDPLCIPTRPEGPSSEPIPARGCARLQSPGVWGRAVRPRITACMLSVLGRSCSRPGCSGHTPAAAAGS